MFRRRPGAGLEFCEQMSAPTLSALAALAVTMLSPVVGHAACVASGRETALSEVVERIESERLRYVFVGERHAIGPVKRFAVELANELADRDHEVGLYVEGFRTGCPAGADACWSLARAFNLDAFGTLLAESKAAVHPLDPPQRDRRAARMAEVIADGSEAVRVVLVGRTHVVHAGDPEAELWVYGGGLRYPDPGDLAEAFPRHEVLTLGLETADDPVPSYSLRRDGCEFDYVVVTEHSTEYWGSEVPRPTTEPPAPAARAVATGALEEATAEVSRDGPASPSTP